MPLLKICEFMNKYYNYVKNNHSEDPELSELIKTINKFENFIIKSYDYTNYWRDAYRDAYKEYIIEDFPLKKHPKEPEFPLSKKEIKLKIQNLLQRQWI